MRKYIALNLRVGRIHVWKHLWCCLLYELSQRVMQDAIPRARGYGLPRRGTTVFERSRGRPLPSVFERQRQIGPWRSPQSTHSLGERGLHGKLAPRYHELTLNLSK